MQRLYVDEVRTFDGFLKRPSLGGDAALLRNERARADDLRRYVSQFLLGFHPTPDGFAGIPEYAEKPDVYVAKRVRRSRRMLQAHHFEGFDEERVLERWRKPAPLPVALESSPPDLSERQAIEALRSAIQRPGP